VLDDMELQTAQPESVRVRNQGLCTEQRHVEPAEQRLEPADRGPAAWKLLGTAFVFEALLWGKMATEQSPSVSLLLI
jgi:hypothetical protein